MILVWSILPPSGWCRSEKETGRSGPETTRHGQSQWWHPFESWFGSSPK